MEAKVMEAKSRVEQRLEEPCTVMVMEVRERGY
jgi:hypothetical protein